MSNTLKTTALLAALTVLFILIGGMVGGEQGMVIAFLFAGLMNFASYWWSDRIVLWMYGAQEASQAEAPELHALIRRLAQRAGLPMPSVYIIPTDTPNAFATGRNPSHAAVAATQGILRILTPDEIEGVMAHELGHVRNRDILISTIAATMAGAIMMLARMAQFAAWFGAGRGATMTRAAGRPESWACCFSPSWPPWRPCSSRWPSPGPGSIWRMRPGPRSAASPGRWRMPWRSWSGRPRPCRWRRIRPRPTCSS